MEGGELLLQHIRFLLLGRNVFLLGLLLLKHSEGVSYNLWEDGFLVFGAGHVGELQRTIYYSLLVLFLLGAVICLWRLSREGGGSSSYRSSVLALSVLKNDILLF